MRCVRLSQAKTVKCSSDHMTMHAFEYLRVFTGTTHTCPDALNLRAAMCTLLKDDYGELHLTFLDSPIQHFFPTCLVVGFTR